MRLAYQLVASVTVSPCRLTVSSHRLYAVLHCRSFGERFGKRGKGDGDGKDGSGTSGGKSFLRKLGRFLGIKRRKDP